MDRSNRDLGTRIFNAGISALFGALALLSGHAAAQANVPEVKENKFQPDPQPFVPGQFRIYFERAAAPPPRPPYDFSRYDSDRMQSVQQYIGADDNVRQNLISARDALAIASTGAFPDTLSPYQHKLVELVAESLKTPIGRDLMAQASEKDIWLCIDNNVWGGGYYKEDLGLISLELKDDGTTKDHGTMDYSSDEAFARSRDVFLRGLYHELTHFVQFRIRNIGSAPGDVRSADSKLWKLGIEAQAELVEQVAMRQHAALHAHLEGPLSYPDVETLRAEFAVLLHDDNFHKQYYEVEKGKLDDGAALPVNDFVNAMGVIPGMPGNFLTGKVRTLEDVYAVTFDLPAAAYPQLNALHMESARPLDSLTLEEVRARGALPGAKMLELPESQGIILVTQTPIGLNIEQYAPSQAGGATVWRAKMYEVQYGDLNARMVGAEVPALGHAGDRVKLSAAGGVVKLAVYRTDPATHHDVLVAGDPSVIEQGIGSNLIPVLVRPHAHDVLRWNF